MDYLREDPNKCKHVIEYARVEDSYPIANLHLITITTGFLPKLGLQFLETLYRYIIKNEFTYVCRCGDKLCGFVSCSLNSQMLMKRFIFYPEGIYKLIIAIVPRPSLWASFFETLIIPRKGFLGRRSLIQLPDVELLAIAIDPDYQNKGIGNLLLATLEQKLRAENVTKYKVVAGSNLLGANMFYKKNGFNLIMETKIHDNIISNVYVKEL